jgi:hypothetical protein
MFQQPQKVLSKVILPITIFHEQLGYLQFGSYKADTEGVTPHFCSRGDNIVSNGYQFYLSKGNVM